MPLPNERSSRPLIPAVSGPGDLLRQLLSALIPGGVFIAPDEDGRHAVAETRLALSGGATTLYGAAFTSEGLLFVIDILVQRNGRWYAYLFRPSTRIKEWHLVDAAMHEGILRQAGIQLADISILLLNMQYVRRGALVAEELFTEERVGRRLRAHQPSARGRMQMLKRMAAKKESRGMQGGAAPSASFRRSGAPSGPAVPAENATDGELEVDRTQLSAFLEGLHYPLYFMDFEAYQTAVPEYDNHWPFRQLPFQFSVHRVDRPGGELFQEAFIAPGGAEPTAAFAAALLDATGTEGSVLVYNLDSEQLILDQLERDHPQWKNPIQALGARMIDLMLPFSKQYIKIPNIGNKLSLKYILPAMVPEMGYSELVIGNGDDANQAYNALRTSSDPIFVEEMRAALLAYCEVDTLAMVRILERMRELVK